jgi:hypothetical protein
MAERESFIEQKSQSQRFRNVLYILWEQRDKQGDFEVYYTTVLERLIDIVKQQLED